MREERGSRVIHGKRVMLRPWQRGDTLAQELWPRYTEPFHSLWNIPSSNGFDLLNGQSVQRYVWAIDDRHRHMIGRISLRDIEPAGAGSRLGISIAQPYVSQGFGTEALELFLDHYFGPLGFKQLSLDVAAFNRRAVRCYDRLGFQYIDSEWRSAGNDPALRLLAEPQYADLTVFFRRNRFETLVEFYEMLLTREEWFGLLR
ncbi:GNAT family N-acetyltransferase [Candidatus Chloroploca sp. Khr17]|uniref:GNAT family N-acetyltransferase n=1 Tax=Candidatus Chloroploca sp. Khr17 TaxID=2496869 RepID=UPI00101B8ABF|nr:GNAT family N-acetyltransferase [Candidatus Chloroploca sp. Khr17]